jgi:hypothetical protein
LGEKHRAFGPRADHALVPDPAQADVRLKERQSSIREWHDRREQVEEREKELQHFLRTPTVVEEETKRVKLIIDNEIPTF